MKLTGTIVNTVQPNENHVIIKFADDKSRQKFKVYIDQPFRKLYLMDTVILNIKFRSICIEENDPIYITELYCEKWEVKSRVPSKIRL